MLAACVFEHVRWPSYTTDLASLEAFGDDKLTRLLHHYEKLFGYLGGARIKVVRQWTRLKLFVSRDDSLRRLKYAELWDRMLITTPTRQILHIILMRFFSC